MSLCCPICEGDSHKCDCGETKKSKVAVGNLVKAINGNALACGSGVYPGAIVVSVEPFVMVSESTDMRWGCFPIEDVEVVGQASEELLNKCMGRL